MNDWIPTLAARHGPRYLAIVEQLEGDIATGRVKPGARLLTHREMAERLGLSVGTVSKAYAEAEARGLISGEVGRGTFVLRRKADGRGEAPEAAGVVNLALNVPPATGEAQAIAHTISEIIADGDVEDLLGYLPHQGRRDHREAIASWLAVYGMRSHVDKIFVTHGAQHALSIALGLVAAPGAVVLTENLTYSGMLALASQHDYRLHGVPMDASGLIPAALEEAFKTSKARVLYCTPTLQTPTGSVMPPERRLAVAEVVRRYDGFLVEDDAYAFLLPTAIEPISTLIPERSFYAVSLAKCLAPGLRVGALIAPESFRDRCINAIRATGWMAAPMMVEVVSRLIASGGLEEQAALKRVQAGVRDAIARRVLSGWLPERSGPPSFHVWLPLPIGRTTTALIAQAAQAGVTLAPPGALRPHDPTSLGVRICLGAAANETELEKALFSVRSILETAEAISLV